MDLLLFASLTRWTCTSVVVLMDTSAAVQPKTSRSEQQKPRIDMEIFAIFLEKSRRDKMNFLIKIWYQNLYEKCLHNSYLFRECLWDVSICLSHLYYNSGYSLQQNLATTILACFNLILKKVKSNSTEQCESSIIKKTSIKDNLFVHELGAIKLGLNNFLSFVILTSR